jgi:WD40 repeat protein
MTTPRIWHTATLLHDGKVLIVGDSTGNAELYDPSTGTFAATGNTITGRGRHTATLLPDGSVLIASSVQSDVSAELYHPSTGTFSPTGSMTTSRNGPTATLLADGRVLIAGGYVYVGGQLNPKGSAELYDPSTGAFTAAGSFPTWWYGSHTATLLPDGKVLFQGSPNAELYDPVTGAFSFTGAMAYPYHYTATLLTNGKVLFTGGDDDPGSSDVAEVYDPSTGLFTLTGNLTKARADHTATLLPDETVLIAGSNGGGGYTDASAELYDPVRGTFSASGTMTTDRGFQTATLLNDGKVLIAGGVHELSSFVWAALSSAELYNPLLLVPAPVLFSHSDQGQGQGAILHAGTPQVASSSNPASVGAALEIYCTGLIEGSVVPPQVAIGGRMAEVLFFGKAPGLANVNQVNVRLPSGVVPGPAVPARLVYLSRPSNEVTIGVQ